MPFYYTPYIILPILSSLINGGLAVYAFRRRHLPAAGWFFWMLVGLSGWSFCYALNTAATELWLKNLLFKLGGSFVAINIFVLLPMVLALVRGEEAVTRTRLALLAGLPLLSLLLIWTNDLHGLIRYDLHLVHKEGMVLLGYRDGSYYRYIHIVYIYLYSLCTILFCFREACRRNQPRRTSLLLIIAAILIPFVTDLFDLTAFREIRLTTSSLFLSGVCYWLAIFRHRLLHLVPLARSTLFEQMLEPVLIVDSQGRLAETNQAARTMLKIPDAAEGMALEELFPDGSPLRWLVSADNGETLQDASSGCWWHVSRTMARHEDACLGWLLVLRDVTELHRSQELLADALASEHEARDEQERFLDMISHEYRTPLAIIQANIDLLGMKETADICMQSGSLGKMQRAVDRLVGIFESARRRKSLDANALTMDMEPVEFLGCFRRAIGAARDFWGERFVCSGEPSPDCVLLADRHLLKTVLLNLLDNAIKFSPADEIVQISVRQSRETLVLEIRNRSAHPLSPDTASLFRKYNRGSNSAGTSGTGVGLYLAGSIAEQHNGNLTFSVDGGDLVTVTLSLPLETRREHANGI